MGLSQAPSGEKGGKLQRILWALNPGLDFVWLFWINSFLQVYKSEKQRADFLLRFSIEIVGKKAAIVIKREPKNHSLLCPPLITSSSWLPTPFLTYQFLRKQLFFEYCPCGRHCAKRCRKQLSEKHGPTLECLLASCGKQSQSNSNDRTLGSIWLSVKAKECLGRGASR